MPLEIKGKITWKGYWLTFYVRVVMLKGPITKTKTKKELNVIDTILPVED